LRYERPNPADELRESPSAMKIGVEQDFGCYPVHPRDEHYGHSTADGRDQGIVKVGKNSSRRHFL
jgi:hypothetical protein